MIFTRKDVIAFIGSMRTAGRVVSCTEERVTLCTTETVALCTAAILVVSLIINTNRLRLSSFSLLVSAVLNWSATHLFGSLSRPNRLRKLNTQPDPRK